MEIDRLSNLPDTVIFHEVVSRLDTNKEAAKTCVLSKDWTHHWYHVHTLCLDYRSFKTRTAFKGFVLHLRFFWGTNRNRYLINGVFNYAMLRKLEELETDVGFPSKPSGLSNSQDYPFWPSMKACSSIIRFRPSYSLNFAWVKNLQLSRVKIDCINGHSDLFSGCQVSNTKIFKISAPRLVQCLLIDIGYDGWIDISAPKLKRLKFKGTYTSTMGCPLFSPQINTWKEESWKYIISLAKLLVEIILVGIASDHNVTIVERKKSLRNYPWERKLSIINGCIG
ncbi:hypothetical protein ACOSP7_003019 [Xanthoceras sorbifolium]